MENAYVSYCSISIRVFLLLVGCSLYKLVHHGWSRSVGSFEFFVYQEGLQNSIACETEDAHEHGSDYHSLEAAHNAWCNPVVDQPCPRRYIMRHGIHCDAIDCSYKENTNYVENETDGVGRAEAEQVFQNEHECIPRSRAEVFPSNRNLNVCIFRYELDESLKAMEDIRCAPYYYLDNWVLFAHLFDLLLVILKDDSYELDQSYQERTECNRAQVISEDPPETSQDRAATVGVRGAAEVPDCATR